MCDFEPLTTNMPRRIVAANTRSLAEQTSDENGPQVELAPILKSTIQQYPLPDPDTNYTAKKNLFKVVGRVTDSHQGNWDGGQMIWQNSYFKIDDGNGQVYTDWGPTTLPATLWVYLAPRAGGLSIYNGDYVACYGFVEPLRWKSAGTPLIMWTTA